jgi:polysaccharide biosynthesis/export protein
VNPTQYQLDIPPGAPERATHRANTLRLHLRTALFALLGIVTLACGGAGSYVWANDAPATYFSSPSPLTIASGDVISVRVFGQDPLSVRATVRSDGTITMPLIGDIAVAGKNPNIVSKEIEARLVPFVTTPNVVVVNEDARIHVVVIGEVRRVGTVVLEHEESGLFAALANSGGITEFADETAVYVMRSSPSGILRLRFLYNEIIRGEGRAATFKLKTGDQIVVE